jgi:hypothetical protein
MQKNSNGSVQNRAAIKVAKKSTADYQYKVNHVIEMFRRHASRSKAQLHLKVGRQKLT